MCISNLFLSFHVGLKKIIILTSGTFVVQNIQLKLVNLQRLNEEISFFSYNFSTTLDDCNSKTQRGIKLFLTDPESSILHLE